MAIQDLLGIHRRILRLIGFYAKVGENVLDILVLVDGHRSIGLEVKLDAQERAWGTDLIQLELCF